MVKYISPVNILFVSKTSSRYVFKTSSAQQYFVFQDIFKTYLQDFLEDENLLRWRRVGDVLKTNKCLLGS